MPTAGQMTPIGPAAADLGLGDALRNQVRGETDEERRRRMMEARMRALMGPAAQALGLSPMMGGQNAGRGR